MSEEAYGERLGKRVGAEQHAALGLDLFRDSSIAVTRVAWEHRRDSLYSSMPLDDAFMVCLELRDLPAHPYWVDGRPTTFAPMKGGDFSLLDLRRHHASELICALDCVAAYLPARALSAFADEHGVAQVDELRIPPAVAVDDPVVRGLLCALLPAMKAPREANRLFLDHAALALIAHMTTTYGAAAADERRGSHGGLAAWQERRAKEALLANIAGNLRLEELATLCGLSRSHFARAFKRSTGLPPHRWLLARRVEAARALLLTSALTLEQIAHRCGFADQSHLSRVFTAFVGTAPGEWRRQRRE